MLLLSLLVALPAAAGTPAATVPEPVFSRSSRRLGVALLIGLEAPETLRPLRAREDVALVARFVERTLGFPAERIHVPAKSPSREGLRAALGALGSRVQAVDQPLLVYVAGRAECDGRSITLAAADGGLPLREVMDVLAAAPSTEKALILDLACEGLPPQVVPLPEGAEITVLAALGGGGRRELTTDGTYGLFTTSWLWGLRGSADFDADGLITWAESAGYARRRLELAAAPPPLFALAGRGAMTLVDGPVVPIAGLDRPEAAQAHPGEIQVEYAGGVGRLYVDGQEVGETPAVLRGLAPGEHRLEVRTARHRSALSLLVAAGEQRTVRLPLGEAIRQGWRLESDPPGAVVKFDGVSLGITPLEVAWPDPATEISISKEDFKTWRGQVNEVPEGIIELRPVDVAVLWSLLMPQGGVEVRLAPRLWAGARGHLLYGFGSVARQGGGVLLGAAVLLRYDASRAQGTWGLELVGGVGYGEIQPLGFSPAMGLVTTIAGVNLRYGLFGIGMEVHGGVHGRDLVALVVPSLSMLHRF